MELTFLRPLYASAGSFASVYLATSGTGYGPDAHAVDIRWRDVREEMARAGADAATLNALGGFITGQGRTAAGTAAFGRDGTVPLAVRLPGVPRREAGRWARLPDVLPLLVQSPPRPPHLLVSATKAGGDVLAVRTADDVTKETVEGTGWPVHKTRSGGSAQLEHQRSAEEAWETNAKELAGAVVQAAAGGAPEAVIVAGDVRARELLISKLPANLASKAVLVDREVAVDSDELAEAAGQVLDELETADGRARLDTYRSRLGAGSATEGLAETVTALREGAVTELFLGGDYLGDDSPGPAWSSAPAWIGSGLAEVGLSEQELRDWGVREVHRDRLDAALVRAATGTDAELFMMPAGEPPLQDGIGALLRFPVRNA